MRRRDCPAAQQRCGRSARLPRARTPCRGGDLACSCGRWSSPGPLAAMGPNAQMRRPRLPIQEGECPRDPRYTCRPMALGPRQLEDGAMPPSLMVGPNHTAPLIVAALDGSVPSRCTTALAAGLIKRMGWHLALVPVPLAATAADRRHRLIAAALDERAALIASPVTDHGSAARKAAACLALAACAPCPHRARRRSPGRGLGPFSSSSTWLHRAKMALRPAPTSARPSMEACGVHFTPWTRSHPSRWSSSRATGLGDFAPSLSASTGSWS
jgi:hypothetical protein